MGLTIDNEAVVAMIRDLAERKGVSPDEALREAVERQVAWEAEVARRVAVLHEVQAEIARLPVLDPRSPDEILGYDESGLPVATSHIRADLSSAHVSTRVSWANTTAPSAA